eukprot:COSAG02_NODE_1254_length_13584_cov_15.001483_8_plen_91_part_00
MYLCTQDTTYCTLELHAPRRYTPARAAAARVARRRRVRGTARGRARSRCGTQPHMYGTTFVRPLVLHLGAARQSRRIYSEPDLGQYYVIP